MSHQRVTDIFEKQLNSVAGRIAVVCDNEAIAPYVPVITQRGNVRIITDPREIPDISREDRFELVIVLGNSVPATLVLYSQCTPFKFQPIPVVFGTQARGLIFEAPTWHAADLHMGGMFYLAATYTRGLRCTGTYVEFGVFDGRSFSLAYHSLKEDCHAFYAFDSFCGIIGSLEDERSLYPEGAYFANCETFLHNMRVVGADLSRIHAIKGSFQDTLKRNPSDYGLTDVKVCHIDSDIYEAAYLALSFIEPALLNGAIILFDEYHAFGCDPARGERRAVNRWLTENPGIRLEHYRNYTAVGSAFVFRRN